MKTNRCLLIAVTALCGCVHTPDPIAGYKVDVPAGEWSLNALPPILNEPGPPNEANIDEWYRLAEANRLVGKRIDDVIRIYGQDYLISLYRGRRQPRMYYHLAGTRSWSVFGVVVLDANLRVREVTMDPAN